MKRKLPKDFDESLYLELNPDVKQAVLKGAVESGARHYLQYGLKEHRRYKNKKQKLPKDFDESLYLALNPDIEKAFQKGAVESGARHYLQYGAQEHRRYKNQDVYRIYGTSPKNFIRKRYKEYFGKDLDLKNPSGLNEKILWLILYWKHPLIVQCTDKIRMREYVGGLGLSNILPKIYDVYHSSSEINWDELPDRFALKCNHGCKYNIICKDKDRLNKNEAARKLDSWLKVDFGKISYEPHYSKIKPLIFSEEYIEGLNGAWPLDYKINCFNGQPRAVLACSEREKRVKFEWYDLDWNPLDLGLYPNSGKVHRPASLDKMLEYARELSKPFPFVRVDFYDLDGHPILGELTFTPSFGMAESHYYNEEGNEYLGSMLKLPAKKITSDYKDKR